MKDALNDVVITGGSGRAGGSLGDPECVFIGDCEGPPRRRVVEISTQYASGENATAEDMITQVMHTMSARPGISKVGRLDVHYAGTGEPTFNINVFDTIPLLRKALPKRLSGSILPVIFTMAPRSNMNFKSFIAKWINIKNVDLKGNAGLRLAINSTDDYERGLIFNGRCMDIVELSNVMREMPDPVGEKYVLSFASTHRRINAAQLRRLFPPDRFAVELDPLRKETPEDCGSAASRIRTERRLRQEGFDTLAFTFPGEEADIIHDDEEGDDFPLFKTRRGKSRTRQGGSPVKKTSLILKKEV